jgi:hypothetical protein
VGLLPDSNITLIEKGYKVSFINGHAYKVHITSGNRVKDFGEVMSNVVNRNPTSNLNISSNKNLSALTNNSTFGYSGQANNWVTFAQWQNTTGNPITSFNTNWTVPAAPSNPGSQNFAIWTGLEPASGAYPLIQPLLIWGNSGGAIGGGQYWTIVSYIIWQNAAGTLLAAISAPVHNVAPGTALQAQITCTGQQPDGSYNCTSQFVGYTNLAITENVPLNLNSGGTAPAPNIPALNYACQVLEIPTGAPYITSVNEYPNQLDVSMNSINITTGFGGNSTHPAVNWQSSSANNLPNGATLGEHTNIISDNSAGAGEVDLYFNFGMQGIYARLEGGTAHTYTVNYNSIFSQVRRWDPNAPTPMGNQQVYRTMTPINIKFYSDAACTHPLVLANAISVSVTSTATHASGSTYVTTYSVPSGVSSFSIGTTDDVEITGVGSFNLAPIYVDYELNNSYSYTTEPDINLSFE